MHSFQRRRILNNSLKCNRITIIIVSIWVCSVNIISTISLLITVTIVLIIIYVLFVSQQLYIVSSCLVHHLHQIDYSGNAVGSDYCYNDSLSCAVDCHADYKNFC